MVALKVDERNYVDDSVGVEALAASALAASADGRTKMQDDYFDLPATMVAKFSPDVFDLATVTDLFAADSIDSDQYAAGSVDGEHLSTDAKLVVLQSKFVASWGQVNNLVLGTANFINVQTEVFAAAAVNTLRLTVVGKGILYSNTDDSSTRPPDNYRVQIRDSTTNQPLDDGAGGEIYGVLYDNVGTLAIAFAKGTDDSLIAMSSQTIDFLFAEIFDLGDMPGTALLDGPSFGDISATTSAHTHTLSEISDVSTTEAELDQALDGISANVTAANLSTLTGSGETTLHIHDGRYYTETELDAGQLDTRYFTETELGAVGGTDGAKLIGVDASALGSNAGAVDTVYGVLDALEAAIAAVPGAETLVPNEAVTAEATTATLALTDTLANSPATVAETECYINGLKATYGVHFTVATNVVTWLGAAFELKVADQLRFRYTF